MKKLEVLLAAMAAALAANPQDEKALAQKELSEAYAEQQDELLSKLKVSEDHNTELLSKLKTSEDGNTELLSKLKASEDRNVELELELEDAKGQLAKTTNQLASEKPSFELNGKNYEVIARRANVPGVGVVTAADIIADRELQQALVSKGSGVIRVKA
ncbi:MAG: hypothetical protein ACTHKV_03750 [Flavipsychrobacter sp.]